MVVLALTKLQQETNVPQFQWGKDHVRILKTCKFNVIKGNSSHFGSSGEYFSLGDISNYGMVDLSSVAPYVLKMYNSKDKTDRTIVNAKVMEYMSCKEL